MRLQARSPLFAHFLLAQHYKILSGFADLATTVVINKSQLHPVPESAVRISVAGQRGLKFHGIPILPTDPPGAVRQTPRFSVTMLKKGSDTFLRPRGERMLPQT